MAWAILSDLLWEPGDSLPSSQGYSEDHMRIPVEAVMLGHESPKLPDANENGKKLPVVEFRMYDDDGELYFEGRLHDDDECLNQIAALKWGEADAGCTTIKVRRDDGKGWVQEIG